ncbi:hypothetical protein Tco_0495937 [Tanacetum coccineum]
MVYVRLTGTSASNDKGKEKLNDDDTSLDAPVFSYSDSSNDSHDYMSEDSSEALINFLTEEEEPKPLDVPMQTKEEYPVLFDIEEVVVVKKPYSLVKVTNVVLGLRAPKAKVGCSGSGRKRNS